MEPTYFRTSPHDVRRGRERRGTMGPEDKGKYTVYWNGVPLSDTPIAPGIIHKIELSADAPNQEGVPLLGPMEFTMYIKVPKHWHCKSRRRFIKLLMSKGISRNQAKRVAGVARIAGVPYGELWQSYFFWGEGL